ncbi:MAG: ferrous iron transport protein B [Leptospirales bacterium]
MPAPNEIIKVENTVYLIGNPNVGKSVIFSALTKKYATVSNYPGTTVEVTKGLIPGNLLKKQKIELVDTPGVNNLVPLSEDERVTRDILYNHEKATGKKPRVVLVIDAKNLRRGLILAYQLAYSDIPYFVVLNMMDEANSLGINIDRKLLQKKLGVPVIPAIAIQKEGIHEINQLIHETFQTSSATLSFPAEHQNAIESMIATVHPLLSLSVFYSDTTVRDMLKVAQVEEAEKILAKSTLNHKRFQIIWVEHANNLMSEVYQREIASQSGFLNFLGHLSIRPLTGSFLLLGVLYLIYQFVGFLGAQVGVDFLEKTLFADYINPFFISVFTYISPPDLIFDLFVGKYGLLTMGVTYAVAIILPIVITFFIAFSFLEDSGYLPRMGALLNTMFKYMGLNGKAVLPMVLGLGCDTMATMTARVLDNRKERVLVTLLLALGVPCSAQLGVMFAFGVHLSFGYVLAWALIVFSILVIVGFTASKLMPGRTSMFLMELPPLRLPQAINIFRKTYMRSKWYIKEAVPIFILGTFLLFLLDTLQILPLLNEWLKPITVHALGLPAESAKGFILGFLRRDFGAAGFLVMMEDGLLNSRQALVSLVVITLFVPCVANLLMMIKERGFKTAMAIVFFIIPFSFLIGTILNYTLRLFSL